MTTHQDANAPSHTLPSYVFVLPWDLNLTGGVNQVVINLHREMRAAAELEPLVMVSRWEAFRPVEKIIDGRRTVYLRLWAPLTEGGSIVGLVKWILASPVWIFDLIRFCRRYRVIAFNFHFAGLTAFPIALLRFLRLYRGALIVSFHGADLTNARAGGRIEGWLWRFVLHSASSVVACSQALAQDVREFVGNGTGRVGAIQNGLDINHFLESVQSATSLRPILRDREFVLSVATWEEKKGLDTLLRAFAEVKRIVSGFALVLIGRSGGAEASLRALASSLGIADDVVFVENLSHAEVGAYLGQAKAFCLPSRIEPFGIAILEAGAFRLPVVASRVGGIPEIVIDEQTGLLTEPEDVTGLVHALTRVLSDDTLARELGERLHYRVATDFSWARAYRAYRTLVPISKQPE